jgi:CheY-like chemotaxis protein
MPDTRRKLLVVEHDAELLDLLATPLLARGFEVASAPSWSSALSNLRARPLPAAMVVDVSAAGFDTSPLALALRDEPALAAVPIVVIATSPALHRELPPHTVAVLIGRPVRGRLLVEVVQRLFRDREHSTTVQRDRQTG